MKTMKHLLTSLCILLGWLMPLNMSAQGHHSFPLKDSTRQYVRLLFAGDAMQHSTQFKWAWDAKNRQYDYEPNFRYLRPYLADADVSVVNFETTLSGKPYSGYPKFRTPDAFLYALADAGFQIFALANNHILDGDKKGMLRTLKKLSMWMI